MPRRRIDGYWRERVRTLCESTPRLSSARIYGMLQDEGRASNRNDYPSEKTVRNIMAEHRRAPDNTRQEYRSVKWPESFGTPDLPWEAAAPILALIRSDPDDPPVTVRVAKWFWRLFLATGGSLELGVCTRYARAMAAAEAIGDSERTWRDIERNLLHPDSPMVIAMVHGREQLDVVEEEGFFPKGTADEIRSSFPEKESETNGR